MFILNSKDKIKQEFRNKLIEASNFLYDQYDENCFLLNNGESEMLQNLLSLIKSIKE